MPYALSTFQLPCGRPCGQVIWSGVTTKEEAAAVVQNLGPGGKIEGLSLLVLSQNMESMTAEARRLFGDAPDVGWVAIVVSSPLIRVTTNFILRMSKSSKRQMFSSEQEAIRWLDERVREDAAKAKPS
ncbi:MAG TPA: STAS/SEC14 domain-containing protein [Myxococcales bacterium]|nr:STAS/SEC14 domain-containing protein [Myxococcales bacterium]